jgi:hypothetical protein
LPRSAWWPASLQVRWRRPPSVMPLAHRGGASAAARARGS